jgi:hypothetical protein
MRRRLRSLRARQRPMARPPGGVDAPFNLSPRALRIAGWLVAAILIVGIAVVVGLLGGDADETGVGAGPSASASGGAATGSKITFGTSIDQATGEVPEDARTDRFTASDTFAYSVTRPGTPPDPVYVEVRRTGAGIVEVVQAAVDGMQPLEYPPAIAFDVPADDLFEVFGPGEYLMLIYADPEDEPIAEGTFTLVGPDASPAASP